MARRQRRTSRGRSARAGACALLVVFATLAVWLWPARALAHAVGLSRGQYTVTPGRVTADIVFARREIVELVPSLDPDKSGNIEERDLARAKPDVERVVLGGFDVRADGAPCPGTLENASLTEQDGLALEAVFTCPPAAASVTVHLKILADLARSHRHIARAVAGTTNVDSVLYGHLDSFEIATGAAAAQTAPAPPAPSAAASYGFFTFLRMGIEHILTGYDHLVFLFGLIVIGGKLKSLVKVVTAFTVGHSITLALATLDIWAPSPRFVEPAIALSIAYIGLENFFVKSADNRWRITFPFGFVHGFGFAGALKEIQLPHAKIPVALVSFNLGVEVGQLAVMAVVLPVVLYLGKREWFKVHAVRVLSVAVIGAGLIWFVERVIHPA